MRGAVPRGLLVWVLAIAQVPDPFERDEDAIGELYRRPNVRIGQACGALDPVTVDSGLQ